VGNQCQILINGMPSGTSFIPDFTIYPPGTQFQCGCVPQTGQCIPDPTGFACQQTQCPNLNETCVPRCIKVSMNGQQSVVDCDCRPDTECHAILGAALPLCQGGCPLGESCAQIATFNPADGSTTYCCDCRPDPQPCEPLPDRSACRQVICPVPPTGEECKPKCILIDFNGVALITECDCVGPNECHAEMLGGAAIPECVGDCPPGFVCIQRVTATPTGTEYCCECVEDPPFCEPTLDGQGCEQFHCPGPIPPTEVCRPRCVRMNSQGTFTVIDCDCRGLNECHVEFQQGITPFCAGNCPPGETCLQNIIDNGDGTFDVCCDCVPLYCECPGDIDANGIINGLDIAGFVRCFLGVPLAVDHCECVDIDGDGFYTLVDVDLFIALMLGKAKCFDVPCCPQADLVLNIGTGINDDGSFIPIGNDDDNWISVNDPNGGTVPRPSTVVAPHTSWLTIPGTQWISTNYFGINGDYYYDYCFCIDERYRSPTLTLQMRGDDDSEVYLNGNFLGFGAPFSAAVPATISTSNPAFFHPGENCIRVKVINIGGPPTGFNMKGTVTVPKGKCCCPPADLNKDIASGVYDNGGGLIPVSLDDDTWNVTVDPNGGSVPRPATVITPHPAWLTIPGTQWISAAQYGVNGTYVYQYCFCLDPRFQGATLNLDLRADDYATVWLNGIQVGATPTSYAFNTPQPTHVFVTNQLLFRPCENCIEIRVTNSHGVVTGLNVAGTITAIDGLCCDDRQYSCCLPDGNCIDLAPGVTECPDGSPAMLGQCSLNPQGCCLPNGDCINTDPRCCKAAGGTVLSPGVTCSAGQPQACCFGSPFGSSCLTIDPVCCVYLYDGQPQGPGTICLGDNNFNGIDDACEPPPACEVIPATGLCSTAPCPIPGETCFMTCALVVTGSMQFIQAIGCDCKSPNECHLELTPAPSVPFCAGSCPFGNPCLLNVTDNGDGTSTACCGCGPPPP
jgi:hypothetical protein